MEKGHRRIVRSAFFSGFGTLLSRFAGLAREMLMAALFGTGMVADSFAAAFRFPNLLRRVFGEGGLKVVLVPRYTQEREELGNYEAFILASSLSVVLAIAISLVIFIGIWTAPYLTYIFAHGWRNDPQKFALTVKLLRFLFSYIGFMTMATWCAAILNSHRKFFLPALAPAFLNLGWLGGATIALWKFSGAAQQQQAIIVASGVLVGGLLQFLVQIPMMWSIGFKFVPKILKKIPAILEIGKLLTPALFGLAVGEINFLVDVFLASYLPGGSVAALTYANRLIYLPMGLASVAMATATLPELSSLAAQKKFEQFNKTLSFSFRTLLGIMLPISAYIIVLREPIVRFLFERGSFSGAVSTPMTAYALAMYAVGLYAFSSFKILTQGFYALKDTKTPVINAAIALSINIVLNLLLIGPMKHAGLALASSIAAIIQVFLLLWWLDRRNVLRMRDEMASFSRIIFASAILGAITYIAAIATMSFSYGTSFSARTVQLAIPSAIWLAALIAIAYLFKITEISAFLEIARKKILRRTR